MLPIFRGLVIPRFFEDGRSVLCVVELCEHGDLSKLLERQASEAGGWGTSPVGQMGK